MKVGSKAELFSVLYLAFLILVVPCCKFTDPPVCSEGRQMTSVANIPETFSVLVELSSCDSKTVSKDQIGLLFMRLEHRAFLVKKHFVELRLHIFAPNDPKRLRHRFNDLV